MYFNIYLSKFFIRMNNKKKLLLLYLMNKLPNNVKIVYLIIIFSRSSIYP